MFKLARGHVAASIGAVVIVVASAGTAFAYWTHAGGGSGTAAVGTSGAIALVATVPSGIVPGGTAPVAFTVSNAGTAPVKVGTVHLAGITVDAAHSTCVTADFTMPDVVEAQSVPPGASAQALANGGTMTFANTAIVQDACKLATLTLALTSS
jgi:hypothetical protein